MFGLSPLSLAKSWLRANTQATATNLPIYNILVAQKVPLSKITEDVITCDLVPPQSKILATAMPLVVHALLQLVIFMTKQKYLKNFFEWIILYH